MYVRARLVSDLLPAIRAALASDYRRFHLAPCASSFGSRALTLIPIPQINQHAENK